MAGVNLRDEFSQSMESACSAKKRARSGGAWPRNTGSQWLNFYLLRLARTPSFMKALRESRSIVAEMERISPVLGTLATDTPTPSAGVSSSLSLEWKQQVSVLSLSASLRIETKASMAASRLWNSGQA